MKQKSLFGVDEISNQIKLGEGLVLEINRLKQKATLYRKGTFVKTVNLLDNAEKRLFTVEIAELGANITSLASGLGITRQTVYNYLEIKKYYGLEGLIHSYTTSDDSRSLRQQRKDHSHKRHQGNKAKQVAELRKKEKQAQDELKEHQSTFNFSFGYEHQVEKSELPFTEEHDWKFSRYAGICTYLIPMITEWKWLQLLMKYFGSAYKIFMVFLLMAGRNIRSIEQLKNIRLREAGIALGVKRVPSKPKVWEWFYIVCEKGISRFIKRDYFRHQLRTGLVGFWLWFTDGHLLPYTGKEKVHYSYNTQRRMVYPGQTNFVTCDESGRIVDFEIQEGKGDLRGRIKQLPQEWINEIPSTAVQVFDREGDGVGVYMWRRSEYRIYGQ